MAHRPRGLTPGARPCHTTRHQRPASRGPGHGCVPGPWGAASASSPPPPRRKPPAGPGHRWPASVSGHGPRWATQRPPFHVQLRSLSAFWAQPRGGHRRSEPGPTRGGGCHRASVRTRPSPGTSPRLSTRGHPLTLRRVPRAPAGELAEKGRGGSGVLGRPGSPTPSPVSVRHRARGRSPPPPHGLPPLPPRSKSPWGGRRGRQQEL